MSSSDVLVRAFATTTCRARLLRLLHRVDSDGPLSADEVMRNAGASVCDAGHDLHYAALKPMLVSGESGDLRLSRQGADLLLDAGRPSPVWEEGVAPGSPPLRSWQAEALRTWCDHGRYGVVEAVTGTGKSRVGIEATREALADDYNVVIMVPTVDLVGQWVRTLKQNSVSAVGALGDGKRASFATHQVIVGTVQSLYGNPPTRPDGKVLLVADECHRYGAGQWSRALHPSYRRRLGLTATFERNDDGINQLLAYFGGGPVYRLGFKRAIADGVVAHYDVKLLGVSLEPHERRDYDRAEESVKDARLQLLAADFPAEPFGAFLHEVQKAADDDPDPTISDLARRYLKAFSERIDIMTRAQAKLDATRLLAPEIKQSRGAIVFTRRVDMSEEIAGTLVENGVKAAAVHSETPRSERQDLLTSLKIGRLKALVAPTILDEGLDVPDIDLGVVMGGSRSRRQMIQRMGRVLRLKEGGRKATFIVVYAENTAEDITRTDGAEGCLDLIVESADTVTHLIADDNRLRPDTAAVTPLQRRATPSSAHKSPVPVVPEAQDLPQPCGSPVEVLDQTDPSTLHMTRRVLDDYVTAHGVEEEEASRDLRQMLADFKMGAEPTWWPRVAGAVVLRHYGFELMVTADRFVRYASHRRDALTWGDLRELRTARAATQHVDASAQGGFGAPSRCPDSASCDSTPAVAAEAAVGPTAIAAATVAFDSRLVKDAGLILGVSLPFAEVEAGLRKALADDLVADPTITSSGGFIEIVGDQGTWTVRGDGRVVHRLRLHGAAPTPAEVPVAAPKSGGGTTAKASGPDAVSLEADPDLLYDLLDPPTAFFEMRAVAQAARGLGLGAPESEDTLRAVREVLADDLAEKPDITSVLGRVTVHGCRARWTLRGRDLAVIEVDVSAQHAITADDGEPDTLVRQGAAQTDTPVAGDRADLPFEADARVIMNGPTAPAEEQPQADLATGGDLPAAVPVLGTDLVSQIERLADLKERGYLTDDEFAAAKTKILA